MTYSCLQSIVNSLVNISLLFIIIIIIIIIIITGTTALCEPWPSSGFLNSLIFTV
jgi:hypothetical protein